MAVKNSNTVIGENTLIPVVGSEDVAIELIPEHWYEECTVTLCSGEEGNTGSTS